MEWTLEQLRTLMGKFLVATSISFLILFPQSLSIPSKSREHSGVVLSSPELKERDCLISALYHEARSEPEEGIRAVLTVIKNRKNHKNYPDTFCKVIHQPKQFSYRNNLKPGDKMPVKPLKALDKEKHRLISSLADEALTGRFKPVLEPSVLHYAHKDVKNRWTKKFKVVKIAGSHKFYKES